MIKHGVRNGAVENPFFLLGAIFCSLALLVFPFSSAIWMAVGLLWILDAANNTAMEPYRAFIGDKLPEEQQTYGFQMQSLFVGGGITLANLFSFCFSKIFWRNFRIGRYSCVGLLFFFLRIVLFHCFCCMVGL